MDPVDNKHFGTQLEMLGLAENYGRIDGESEGVSLETLLNKTKKEEAPASKPPRISLPQANILIIRGESRQYVTHSDYYQCTKFVEGETARYKNHTSQRSFSTALSCELDVARPVSTNNCVRFALGAENAYWKQPDGGRRFGSQASCEES